MRFLRLISLSFTLLYLVSAPTHACIKQVIVVSEAEEAVFSDYEGRAPEYSEAADRINTEKTLSTFLEVVPPNGTILEAGPGSGRDLAWMIKYGLKVVAAEPVNAFHRIILEKYDRLISEDPLSNNSLTLLRARVQDLDFPDETFDGFYSMASMGYVPKEIEVEAYKNIARWMKKGTVGFTSYFAQSTSEDALRDLFAQIPLLEIVSIHQVQAPGTDGRMHLWFNIWFKKI